MAVTSLWRVKGYVGKVILYAMNKEKTTEKEIVETGHDDTNPKTVLRDLFAYTERDEATNQKQFVTAINGSIEHIKEEMMIVKKRFEKKGGTVAYHGFQSFREGEVTPEQAHDLGVKLATELWGDCYQVLVTTHLDKDSHLHNHFVINTVSFVDGIKFHRTKKDYVQMREVSDRLCREYGLSVIEHPQGKGIHYAEWRAEKNGEPTKNSIIKLDLEECIEISDTVKQFYREMARRGYTFNFDRKYPTISHPQFSRPRRLQTLGESYTPEAIAQRIKSRWMGKDIDVPPQDDPEISFFGGNRYDPAVFSNYRMVYVHYVCGLEIVKTRQPYNRYLYRMLGEELIKFQKRTEEQNLMLDNDLYTDEDVKRYLGDLQTEIPELLDARQRFRNALKRAVRAEDLPKQQEYKDEIALLTARLSLVRKQTKICERILAEEPAVEQHLREVQSYTEQIKRKEEPPHEHIGRSGRTGRPNLYGRD